MPAEGVDAAGVPVAVVGVASRPFVPRIVDEAVVVVESWGVERWPSVGGVEVAVVVVGGTGSDIF